jgi:hypothetical protein
VDKREKTLGNVWSLNVVLSSVHIKSRHKDAAMIELLKIYFIAKTDSIVSRSGCDINSRTIAQNFTTIAIQMDRKCKEPATFYASSLDPPKAKCARLRIFSARTSYTKQLKFKSTFLRPKNRTTGAIHHSPTQRRTTV